METLGFARLQDAHRIEYEFNCRTRGEVKSCDRVTATVASSDAIYVELYRGSSVLGKATQRYYGGWLARGLDLTMTSEKTANFAVQVSPDHRSITISYGDPQWSSSASHQVTIDTAVESAQQYVDGNRIFGWERFLRGAIDNMQECITNGIYCHDPMHYRSSAARGMAEINAADDAPVYRLNSLSGNGVNNRAKDFTPLVQRYRAIRDRFNALPSICHRNDADMRRELEGFWKRAQLNITVEGMRQLCRDTFTQQ